MKITAISQVERVTATSEIPTDLNSTVATSSNYNIIMTGKAPNG